MERLRHGQDEAHRPKLARLRKILPLLILALSVGDKVRRVMQGPPGPYSYRPSLPVQLYANLSVFIDQRVPWHKLPVPLALAVMIGDRIKLELSPYDLTRGRIVYRYRESDGNAAPVAR